MYTIQQVKNARTASFLLGTVLSIQILVAHNPVTTKLPARHFAPPTGTIRIDHHTLESHTAPRYCFNNNGVSVSNQPVNRLSAIPITQEMGGEEITIKGVADSNACLTSRVRFVISNIKAIGCSANTPPSVTVSDSRFQLRDTVWSATVRFNWQGEEQFFNVKLTDGCGNTTTQRVKMIFEDNMPPKAITNPTVIRVPRGVTVAQLRVTDIGANSTDNCALKTLMMRSADAAASDCWTNVLELSCTNAFSTTYNVVVRAIDNNNMASEKMATVTIENATSEPLNAGISNQAGVAIDNVNVALSSGSTVLSSQNTAVNGTFSVILPYVFNNLTLKPTKTDLSDVKEGVTTSDLLSISKHILATTVLPDPYAIIAADVDKNGVVEALDMVKLRQFILWQSASLEAGNFRFVPQNYVFQNPKSPLDESFPEVLTLTNFQSATNLNFKAVKIGDVNYSFRHILQRSSRRLTLTTDDLAMEAGKTYTFTIKTAQFDAASFQGTLSCKGLTIKGFQVGNLKDMSEANFGRFRDALTMSWNGSNTEGGYDLVTVTVLAQESGKLSQFLSFGSALTAAEAVTENGEGRTIVLTFNTDKLLDKTADDKLILHQNTPNPVSGTTRIGFYLPSESAADLAVFNAAGQLILRKNGQFSAGQNAFVLQKSELTTGVLYYQVSAAGQKAVRKMVVLE